MKRLLPILLLLLTASPAWAAYAYKGTFTVQASQMPSSQTDFPFLIYWTDNVLKQTGGGGQVTDAQGDDIRPYSTSDCSTTALTYQRFFYDGTAGTIGMRVKSTGGVGHTIYLCVGDSGVTSDGSSTGTWNSNYLAFWNLGDGSTLSLANSTSATITLTNNGTVTAAAGKVGGGTATLNGTSQYLSHATLPSLGADASMTVAFWNNVSTAAAAQAYTLGNQGNPDRNTSTAPYNDDNIYFDYGSTRVTASYTSFLGGWAYVAFVFDAGTDLHRVYINGSAAASDTNADSPTTTISGIQIGAATFASLFHNGAMDEFRVSDVARSADWVESEYKNENSQATFWGSVTFDVVSGGGGANSSYYRQQLQRVLR